MTVEEQRRDLFEQGSMFAPAARADIVGIDPILDKLDPVIFWLRNHTLNVRVEPGVLFQGSPGTGKTLCARYLATQANATFINVRDWPLWTNEFTSRDIKDLFEAARASYQENNKPVILFWDEFELYAQDRSISSSRMAGVVSQITAELDGVAGKPSGVLLVGCTNYRENIDPALLRAGRMGMQFFFRAPDREGKRILLQHYLEKYSCGEVDLESAAQLFSDDVPAAEIEECVNGIWLNTVIESIAHNTTPQINDRIIKRTLIQNFLGEPASFTEPDSISRYHIAIHELGHALIARTLEVPVRFITVQPGIALGKTLTVHPNESLMSVEDSINQIKIYLGGIYAERLLGLPDLVNSHKDIYQATVLANRVSGTHGVTFEGSTLLVDFFGFDVKDRSVNSSMSSGLKQRFDEELINLIFRCQNDVEDRIKKVGGDKIAILANMLVEEITWTGKDFDKVCRELMIP